MANISKFLQDIMRAVYGEEVRTSIHDAIDIINKVAERAITAGEDVTEEGSPSSGFYDTSLYLNTVTDDLWQFNGSKWILKGNLKGKSVVSITKKETNVLVDTYTILFSDGNTTDFNVTNGRGIESITLDSQTGLIDNYVINYNDGSSQPYSVANGRGIDSIDLESQTGLVDNYIIHFNDGSTQPYSVANGRGITSLEKTSSEELVDIYTITYNDGTTEEITVTNGVNGNRWFRGVGISGKANKPTVYASSGIPYARVDDYYMNYAEGAIYYCVGAGDPDNALWKYDFTIAGGGSGVSTWADLLYKPFDFVGNAGLEITGNEESKTLRAKVDGSYIAFDQNGALTLNSDIIKLLYKYYDGHFRTDEETRRVYLSDIIMNKISKLDSVEDGDEEDGEVTKELADVTQKLCGIVGGAEYSNDKTYGANDGLDHVCILGNKVYSAIKASFSGIEPTVTSGWEDYWKETSISQLKKDLNNMYVSEIRAAPTIGPIAANNFKSSSFDVSKDGYIPIMAVPRTSGHNDGIITNVQLSGNTINYGIWSYYNQTYAASFSVLYKKK